jgi:hypothetical protein
VSKTVEFLIRQNLITVFSERDAEKRRAIIASLWAADGVFIDPDGVHVGREAIDQTAEQLLRKYRDFVFTELGPVDGYHGIGRLAWGFGPPGAVPAMTGIDVLVSANEQISNLYTFVDPAKS